MARSFSYKIASQFFFFCSILGDWSVLPRDSYLTFWRQMKLFVIELCYSVLKNLRNSGNHLFFPHALFARCPFLEKKNSILFINSILLWRKNLPTINPIWLSFSWDAVKPKKRLAYCPLFELSAGTHRWGNEVCKALQVYKTQFLLSREIRKSVYP